LVQSAEAVVNLPAVQRGLPLSLPLRKRIAHVMPVPPCLPLNRLTFAILENLTHGIAAVFFLFLTSPPQGNWTHSSLLLSRLIPSLLHETSDPSPRVSPKRGEISPLTFFLSPWFSNDRRWPPSFYVVSGEDRKIFPPSTLSPPSKLFSPWAFSPTPFLPDTTD